MQIYAAWKGDEFLIADTLERVAEYLGNAPETVKWYANPTAQKRAEGKNNRLYVIKFNEEE